MFGRSLLKLAGMVLTLAAMQAAAVDVAPVVDTYVHSYYPNNTYGTKTTLEIKSAATSNRDAYLKFDLSALSNISKVELKLYGNYSVASGSATTALYKVASTSWDNSITWNLKPPMGAQLGSATVTFTSVWFTFDVTSYVLEQYNQGNKIIAFGLHNTTESESHVKFNSSDNTANKPVLVVTTAGLTKGAMEYYDGAKWVTLPAGKPGEFLSVAADKAPSWKQVPGTVSDADGNVYRTIIIGSQEWTIENLRTTRYRNGDAIPENSGTWSGLTTGVYCYHGWADTPEEKKSYGAYYNWYAVNDSRGLAPEGWRIPTDADWTTLENYLIAHGYNYDGTTSGNKIAKSMAAGFWGSSTLVGGVGNNWRLNNKSGFSAVGSGYREESGGFNPPQGSTYWWSATANGATLANYRMIHFYDANTFNGSSAKHCGYSVRLVRDIAYAGNP